MARSGDPLVSVISSVYNVSGFITDTLNSILDQDYKNLEVIVVDDASTDDTYAILKSFEQQDPRVRVISNDNNIGPSAKNIAISEAKGDFIAVMDGDDIYVPDRISSQVKFMNDHPECLGCSGQAVTFGATRRLIWSYLKPQQINAFVLVAMPVVHPGFMFRAAVVHDLGILYDGNERFIQDYDLVYRISRHGDIRNLNKMLVHYRRHPNQVTASEHGFLSIAYNNVRPFKEKQLADAGLDTSTMDVDVFLRFCYFSPLKGKGEFKELVRILKLLLKANRNNPQVKNIMGSQYLHYLKRNRQFLMQGMAACFRLFNLWNACFYVGINLYKKWFKLTRTLPPPR